jgi:hypothetical protein
MCFVSIFVFAVKVINQGCYQGNMAQALAQWQHPVASSEALDELHWAMCPTSYPHICMEIKIASILLAFFSSSILIVPTTVDNDHVMVNIIINQVAILKCIMSTFYSYIMVSC